MRVITEIEGLAELTKNIEKVNEITSQALKTGTEKAAEVFRDKARGGINSRSGGLRFAIIGQSTWYKKDALKAFAGAGIDQSKDFMFRGKSKRTGKQYYIPAAVEYGHRAPGGGGYTVLATDKEGNFAVYKKGKKKGQLKAAANKYQNKVAKPVQFMKKAYGDKLDRQRAVQIIEGEVRTAIAKAGGFYANVTGGGN